MSGGKGAKMAGGRGTRLFIVPMAMVAVLFVAIPLCYVLVISFMTRGDNSTIQAIFTAENYRRLLDPNYARVFLNSMLLALWTTLLALLLGYPFGYCMARANRRWRALLMLLVIVPFWTNALVRLYGWKILLQANGPVNAVLRALGLIDQPLRMVGSYGSVLLAMVYCLIPFMILPCHSAVDKMDWSCVEAARDLGARPWYAFLTVTLPLTLPGISAGCVLVFVPSLGLFFVSDLMGGSLMLVGNLIRDQLLKSRDWPFGAALSVLLMAVTVLIFGLYRRSGGKDLGVF